jgi:cbb3-type cytochrome oxidase subunit 3
MTDYTQVEAFIAAVAVVALPTFLLGLVIWCFWRSNWPSGNSEN